MTNTKMTNKVALETAIIELRVKPEMAEVVAKLEKMIEAIDKKKASKALTPTQEKNEELKKAITDYLVLTKKKLSISEMMKEVPELMAVEDLTNQRVTSLVSKLVKDHVVEREMDKRKAVFYVVVE